MRAPPRAGTLAAALVLTCTGVWGEPDGFMRAVGFGLTGSDDAEPRAIDRPHCVFAIGKDVFYLNNVQTDRLAIRLMGQATTHGERRWVRVELHGDLPVYEHVDEPMKDDGSELARQLKLSRPDLFKPKHVATKEHTLELQTEDQDRVARAWDYIYKHGCDGKESPF